MTQNQVVLSVENLCKTIGKRKIIDNVSFQIHKGEVFGFLGPNGAGKTTTIRMLVGLIRPTRGRIRIGNYDLQNDFLNAIRHVGCIVENPESYPYLTGRENLELFTRMVDSIPKQRIDEVIKWVELDERIDDPVNTYSLGMKQRLGIAQALLGKPQLLILDEPTNGLDPAGIRELRSFVRKLADEKGMSVFISSHILHEIQLLCDRVAIIHQGKVLTTERMDQLINRSTQIAWILSPFHKGKEIMNQLPYITIVQAIEEQNKILVQMPPDQIAEANQQLVDKQVQVTGIHPYQMTLEDIFLQITGSDVVV